MKLGILGSGDVGKALAKGFAGRKHDVVMGTRDPAALDAWVKEEGAGVRVAGLPEAAGHGELVVVCVMGAALEAALDAAGPDRFAGKIVIDATNPLDVSKGMPPGNLYGLEDSNGERAQGKLPGAKVVKAFNTVPNARMVDPGLEGARMLVAGDDPDAKAEVESLLKSLGWAGVIDVGGIRESRWLEALVPLWVRAGMALGRWDHVFDVRY